MLEIVVELGLLNDILFVLGGVDGLFFNLGLGVFGDMIVVLIVGMSGVFCFIII